MPKRICILEDDPGVCKSLMSGLEKAGYAAEYHYHANDAWRAMHQRKPDLLLLDTGLPDIHGWEFADRMRKDSTLTKMPIVVLTEKVGFLERMGAKMHGISGFLKKPFRRPELEKAVKEALGEQ